jgi:hypothetical protein
MWMLEVSLDWLIKILNICSKDGKTEPAAKGSKARSGAPYLSAISDR